MQTDASFEGNPESKSSKMVEFGTFVSLIALLEYVIEKLPSKLLVKLFPIFSGFKCATCQVITSKVVSFHQWPDVFHRWPEVFHRCPEVGLPMAMDGILSNFSHRWPRVDHTCHWWVRWKYHGHR